MPDYTVKFVGHMKEQTRPENFPKQIYAIGTYTAENPRQLAEQINSEVMMILQMQGMIIQTDPAATVDMSKVNVNGRVFVPMHMLAYIRTEISQMTPMPRIVDTGIVDPSGKAITGFETPDGKKVIPS